jgi:GNAT superfamily N-acetyltransferase
VSEDARIRTGRDADADGFIALIGACWAEYPSIVFDVDAELPELYALESHYRSKRGMLWAAEAEGAVVGMIAVAPHGDGAWEICRLYVAAPWRGAGLAHELLDRAEAHARAAGATRLLLWSDTRFDRAHRFYEKRGYVRSGPVRPLNDLSNSLEFAYAKPVNGAEALDAAGVLSAERALVDLQVACAHLAPSTLRSDAARAYWHRAAGCVAARETMVVAGWHDARLAGCVLLRSDMPADQAHRVVLELILATPEARRHGLARTMLERSEQEAVRAGRTLLSAELPADNASIADFHSQGWNEAGRIPAGAGPPGGPRRDLLILYRQLSPA